MAEFFDEWSENNEMKKVMICTISWLSPEEGGRNVPMAENIRYCPIIKLSNMTDHSKSWSADIYVQSQIEKYKSIATLCFLFEAAPCELLQVGIDFELFEGRRLVARGTICSSDSSET